MDSYVNRFTERQPSARCQRTFYDWLSFWCASPSKWLPAIWRIGPRQQALHTGESPTARWYWWGSFCIARPSALNSPLRDNIECKAVERDQWHYGNHSTVPMIGFGRPPNRVLSSTNFLIVYSTRQPLPLSPEPPIPWMKCPTWPRGAPCSPPEPACYHHSKNRKYPNQQLRIAFHLISCLLWVLPLVPVPWLVDWGGVAGNRELLPLPPQSMPVGIVSLAFDIS